MNDKREEYNNDREIDILGSIFKKSGIDNIKKFDMSTEEEKTDIDVFGVYKNVIILVECVGMDELGPKIKKAITDFKKIVENFSEVIKISNSKYRYFYNCHKAGLNSQNRVVKKLLISFNKETKNYVDRTNLNLCSKEKIALWTREDMYYYDKISDCTYDHCKYEIFDHLGLNPEDIERDNKESITLTYSAYGKKIKSDLYILNFVVPVSVLLHRSSIKRLQDSSTEEGYQRLLDKAKLKKMREYLLKGISIYPNNIICTLNKLSTIKKLYKKIDIKLVDDERAKTDVLKEIRSNLFLVELPNVHDVFEIIDGQHRLFSFTQTKYHLYEKIKNASEKRKIKRGDRKIAELSKKSHLVVTAIYSENNEWGDPGKLFLEINTTQTRIKPEDVIDLVEKFCKDSPIAYANRLLKKLNDNGILENKIRFKFWQDRIKRTSLISYSGLKDIFDTGKKSYKIFRKAYEKQGKIKEYIDFCFILINNYLWKVSNFVEEKDKKQFSELSEDITLKKYYLFYAVFIGALIRLLRHFISEKNIEIGVLDKIDTVLKKGEKDKDTININIQNNELQDLFSDALQIIVDKYNFTKEEFYRQEGWGSNKWAKIESDLFYLIRDFKENGKKKYPNFGDEKLISKKHRRI